MDDGGGDAGAGFAGPSGQWVRSRTDRDAKLYLREQREQAGRRRRMRPMGPTERRAFWVATGVVVALGVVHQVTGG